MLKKEIAEFEAKLVRTSSVVKLKEGDKGLSSCWIGWYKPDEEETFRIVLSTMSTSEEYAEKKILKYIGNMCLCGIGKLTPDGKISIIQDKYLMKADEPLPPSVVSKVSSGIMKHASLASQVSIRDFVIIDTETTGLYNKDEVVELAGLRFTDGRPNGEFHTYIIPTVKISPEALKTHGLTEEFLRKNGIHALEAFGQFKAWLKEDVVCCHNFSFDSRMVRVHSKKAKYPIELKKGFCTLELSRKMMNLPNHKLENIINWFDLRKGLGSHNAMDDVIATARYASLLNKVYRYICLEAIG